MTPSHHITVENKSCTPKEARPAQLVCGTGRGQGSLLHSDFPAPQPTHSQTDSNKQTSSPHIFASGCPVIISPRARFPGELAHSKKTDSSHERNLLEVSFMELLLQIKPVGSECLIISQLNSCRSQYGWLSRKPWAKGPLQGNF